MSEANRQILMNVFSSLKQRIVFKWETEDMPNKPDNVLLSKWLPQQDILGHKNVKLFISHGGQSSCQESLCHQKPLVIIKKYFDGLVLFLGLIKAIFSWLFPCLATNHPMVKKPVTKVMAFTFLILKSLLKSSKMPLRNF